MVYFGFKIEVLGYLVMSSESILRLRKLQARLTEQREGRLKRKVKLFHNGIFLIN